MSAQRKAGPSHAQRPASTSPAAPAGKRAAGRPTGQGAAGTGYRAGGGPRAGGTGTAPTNRRATTGGPGRGRPTSRRAGGGGGGKQRRGLVRRLLLWAVLAGFAFFLLGCAAFAYGYMATDIPDPNKDFQAQTTFVYYADGKHEVGRFASQNRTSIPLSDVPDHVQDAMVAAEDRSFYTNKGIDPKGILRAAFSNARGGSTQGASTITQQYVKVLYLSQERTLTRKVKEAFVSLKIQRTESKDEVLQGYLNTIYFGRGAYGIQAAAKAYFNKDAAHLTVSEGAALASILNSPIALDPAEGPDAKERLLGRYQYVVHGMASMGALDADQADRIAERLPKFPKMQSKDQYGGQRGHILTMVKKQLLAKGFSEEEISGGGLKITTTFTRNAMNAASAAVRNQKPKGLKQLHVAVASIDPRTGALRGMYAGQDYLKSQINWATAGGSPGSAFKPFALAAGIKDGYSLKSTFEGNSPYEFPNGDRVVNEGPGDGNDYGDRITLTKATEESVNTAYMDLTQAMDNGPKKILDTAVDLGVPEDAPGLEPTTGISLGSATVSPIDMASSYATIADGGRAKQWYVITKVEDANGQIRYKAPRKSTQALSDDVDRDVSYALQKVVENGTGRNAQAIGRPAAGKTGTATNDNGDVSSSWFVGYTPQLSTAVMYVRGDGNDALNDYLPVYFGSEFPTKTWADVVKNTLDDAPVEEFPPPANLEPRNDDHEPLPTFTPKPTPTETPTPTPTPSPSETPEPTPTPEETPSTPPSETPAPTPTCNLLGCGGGGGGGGGGGNGGSPTPTPSPTPTQQ